MNVHSSNVPSLVRDGYVEIKRTQHEYKGEVFERVDMAHPSRTCLRVMQTKELCLMDKDHRGRCSSVVFFCDGCQKTRRGIPAGYAYDDNGDVDVVFCWFCQNVEVPRAMTLKDVL